MVVSKGKNRTILRDKHHSMKAPLTLMLKRF